MTQRYVRGVNKKRENKSVYPLMRFVFRGKILHACFQLFIIKIRKAPRSVFLFHSRNASHEPANFLSLSLSRIRGHFEASPFSRKCKCTLFGYKSAGGVRRTNLFAMYWVESQFFAEWFLICHQGPGPFKLTTRDSFLLDSAPQNSSEIHFISLIL